MKIEYKLNEIRQVAKTLVSTLKQKTVLFYGEMGVGKTTLIAEIVKTLGSADEVSSPTFSIVNEYHVDKDKVYHFDFFRINDVYEALDIGIEDYFDSGHWVLIEWPEKINAVFFHLTLKKSTFHSPIMSTRTLVLKS
jgi:tRNA threonylcarbamoyladenosine biosynthesis protein TsaE